VWSFSLVCPKIILGSFENLAPGFDGLEVQLLHCILLVGQISFALVEYTDKNNGACCR